MPWKETCTMEERIKFVVEVERADDSIAKLCKVYGISRKTGYKWLNRWQTEGFAGLEERSREPHNHPNQIPEEIENSIVALRHRHPFWGPKKLLARLQRLEPEKHWPVQSTVGEVLRRHGLSCKRKNSRRTPPYTQPFEHIREPNDVWSADFKGWFKTGNGKRVDPLTILDGSSRYLLRCQAMIKPTMSKVRSIFEEVFREYGLPGAIRTDNGMPFASRALGGLSRLSVWWTLLGIIPERIAPGHPEQNGRHERMHRSLKQAVAKPPAPNPIKQQAVMDNFVQEYNHIRPHEALDQKTPSQCYHPSRRAFPERILEPEYSREHTVRRVRTTGEIKWKNKKIFLSEVLVGLPVGLVENDNDLWRVDFGPLSIGMLNERFWKIVPI